MGQDGTSGHDGRPDGDGDAWGRDPDGSLTRRPSPRGGVRGVVDDLIAGKTPIDRQLVVVLLTAVLGVPLLTMALHLIGTPDGTALLVASALFGVVFLVIACRAVARDVRLRRSGRRTGGSVVIAVLLWVPAMIGLSEMGPWLHQIGVDQTAAFALRALVAAGAGLLIGWLAFRVLGGPPPD